MKASLIVFSLRTRASLASCFSAANVAWMRGIFLGVPVGKGAIDSVGIGKWAGRDDQCSATTLVGRWSCDQRPSPLSASTISPPRIWSMFLIGGGARSGLFSGAFGAVLSGSFFSAGGPGTTFCVGFAMAPGASALTLLASDG